MRLIDVDEFGFSMPINESEDFERGCEYAIKKLQKAPTAYDVDKVVKELKKNKLDIAIMLQTSDGTYSDYEYADGIELNKAKEIVKGGLNVGTED